MHDHGEAVRPPPLLDALLGGPELPNLRGRCLVAAFEGDSPPFARLLALLHASVPFPARPLPALERLPQPVEATLPQLAIARDPLVELAEGRCAQRVEAFRPFGTHLNEACVMQDAQVPRNARLVNGDALDDVVHRVLAAAQRLDDPAARGVRERLEY